VRAGVWAGPRGTTEEETTGLVLTGAVAGSSERRGAMAAESSDVREIRVARGFDIGPARMVTATRGRRERTARPRPHRNRRERPTADRRKPTARVDISIGEALSPTLRFAVG
jgi:hypothetical protein